MDYWEDGERSNNRTTTIHHTVTVTPMQTTALMEGDWSALKMFEGKGSRITESFYVPTSEWRI